MQPKTFVNLESGDFSTGALIYCLEECRGPLLKIHSGIDLKNEQGQFYFKRGGRQPQKGYWFFRPKWLW